GQGRSARCVLMRGSNVSPPPADGDPVAAVTATDLSTDTSAAPPAIDRTATASTSRSPNRSVPSVASAPCAAVAIARSVVAFQNLPVQILIRPGPSLA